MNKVLKIKLVGKSQGEKLEEREMVLPLGKDYILKAIDDALATKKKGDEFELTLEPDRAYGNREGNLIKLIPLKFFKKDNVAPYPGLMINVDGIIGRVRSVSPGRVLVDFNHPYAGKTIEYKIKVLDELKDKAQIAQEVLKAAIGIDSTAKELDKKIQVLIETELPVELKNKIEEELTAIIGTTTEILTKKA